MKALLKIDENYGLVAVDDATIKYMFRHSVGDILSCELVKERNIKFHRKGMALVKAVHEALPEPEPINYKGRDLQPIRTFDNTREYLTILAGHYDVVGLPNGKVRAEAKSWKFAKMTEDEFDIFYSNLIDASIKALPRTWSKAELERVAAEILGFV